MNIIKPSVEFIAGYDEMTMLKIIEKIARKCYKSEDKITEDGESAKRMVKMLFDKNHLAMVEHVGITYSVICDRGVTHEIIRHRLGSYAQESTRYCNYSYGKFGNEITVIDLSTGFDYNINNEDDRAIYEEWQKAMDDAERHYMKMIEHGATPQEARSVLPNSLKTEIVITYNLREWLHFFELRFIGTTGAPHPQMREVAKMLYEDAIKRYPYILGTCAQLM